MQQVVGVQSYAQFVLQHRFGKAGIQQSVRSIHLGVVVTDPFVERQHGFQFQIPRQFRCRCQRFADIPGIHFREIGPTSGGDIVVRHCVRGNDELPIGRPCHIYCAQIIERAHAATFLTFPGYAHQVYTIVITKTEHGGQVPLVVLVQCPRMIHIQAAIPVPIDVDRFRCRHACGLVVAHRRGQSVLNKAVIQVKARYGMIDAHAGNGISQRKIMAEGLLQVRITQRHVQRIGVAADVKHAHQIALILS